MADRAALVALVHLRKKQEENVQVLARLLELRRQKRSRRRPRRVWVLPWITRRERLGAYCTLMPELAAEANGALQTKDFYNLLRMEPAMFDELLRRVGPRIRKEDTNYRKALEPGLKLAITLRYLATGESYHSLRFLFRVPHNTISLLIPEVCQAIIAEYEDEVVKFPSNAGEWKQIAQGFSNKWNFEHTVGALDGKHVAVKCPANSGSVYHNYKGFFSIILLGLVDADYKFIWADIGANGATSDCAVFNVSALKNAMDSDTIGFPDPEPLPNDDEDLPFFIIADDAFPLRKDIMKPFSKRNMDNDERIFNYRLSRARRVVENAFGILANRFQCILNTMRQEPETVKTIVTACVCLHNLMRMRYPGVQNALVNREDVDHQLIPGAWRDGRSFDEMENTRGGNHIGRAAKHQRLYLKHYYNSVAGSVAWQNDMI